MNSEGYYPNQANAYPAQGVSKQMSFLLGRNLCTHFIDEETEMWSTHHFWNHVPELLIDETDVTIQHAKTLRIPGDKSP